MDFQTKYNENKAYIDQLLIDYLPKRDGNNDLLVDAMEYSLMAGGKRVRGIIMLEVFNIFSQSQELINPFLVAIEMIHTYSLIHDDLPSMDNDDFRRGKPTCHKQFTEGIAVLAGDALLSESIEIMMNHSIKYGDVSMLLASHELVKSSGASGMISGQIADLLNENKVCSIDELDYINIHKTARLLESAFVCGVIVANNNNVIIEKFRQVGRNLGLAFQIQDDILDITSTEEILGKPINSDLKNHKNTYVSLLGLDEANDRMKKLYNEGIELLLEIDHEKTKTLIDIINYLKDRNN